MHLAFLKHYIHVSILAPVASHLVIDIFSSDHHLFMYTYTHMYIILSRPTIVSCEAMEKEAAPI